MKVLIVGAGVVGTVYGAHLAAAGSTVQVLSHGPRTEWPPGASAPGTWPGGESPVRKPP